MLRPNKLIGYTHGALDADDFSIPKLMLVTLIRCKANQQFFWKSSVLEENEYGLDHSTTIRVDRSLRERAVEPRDHSSTHLAWRDKARFADKKSQEADLSISNCLSRGKRLANKLCR